MSTTQKRLDQASEGLTARERATVVIKRWMDGGELDERLTMNAPGDQSQECDRIVDAVGQANEHLHQACALLLEWLRQEETEVAWLQSRAAFIDRTERLESALGAAGRKVEEGKAPSLLKSQRRLIVTALPAATQEQELRRSVATGPACRCHRCDSRSCHPGCDRRVSPTS